MSRVIEIATVKEYEELVYSDDFMFRKTMEDLSLCHDVIECLLQRSVAEFKTGQTEKEYEFTSDGKPIRIDVYNESDISIDIDASGKEIFDTEMQNLNKKTVESYDLPKRSRFYQASIDIDFMKKRFDFSKLPVSNVIFICTFDPFRLGLSTYTFRERCDEAPELVLGDGTEKHFYNCTYTGDDQPEDLKRFYEYIRTGAVTSDLTERIDNAVQTGRKNERWKTMYMREKMLIYDAVKDYEDQLDEANARVDEANSRADEANARANEAESRNITQIIKKLRKNKSPEQIAEELEEDDLEKVSAICGVINNIGLDHTDEEIVAEVLRLK